uniref:Uncharacterized protein n=1 Tax=Knipowitschia caucasica TaxID=637954 RepID=A0AAV2L958_KNICA
MRRVSRASAPLALPGRCRLKMHWRLLTEACVCDGSRTYSTERKVGGAARGRMIVRARAIIAAPLATPALGLISMPASICHKSLSALLVQEKAVDREAWLMV